MQKLLVRRSMHVSTETLRSASCAFAAGRGFSDGASASVVLRSSRRGGFGGAVFQYGVPSSDLEGLCFGIRSESNVEALSLIYSQSLWRYQVHSLDASRRGRAHT